MVDLNKLDKKWQKKWANKSLFKAREDSKKNYYVLEMYPYPSGKLHMGHLRNYSIGDSFARYKRMNGFNVLYPMGYDSFGLPAENAAIKNKSHPRKWTLKCIGEMKQQQQSLGLSYDWDRFVSSMDPEYYKWNQWFFLEFYKKGLVYRKKAPINWCSKCNTVLANEQVHQGKCWRCESEVSIRDLEQWFIKTTKYAEELLKDLDKLDWPQRVKIMQENWIGKSHGTQVNFKLKSGEEMPIFTTRPDTLWGVTFMVFAPEHPKVMELIKGTKYEKKVKEFINKVVLKEKFERTADSTEKEGLFIGQYAINPVNGEEIPIYIANFVLLDYGTGFIMAVPTHDQRDFEFAKKYKIPMRVVINPPEYELTASKMSRAYLGDGNLVNSEDFDGTHNKDAIEAINKWLEKNKLGKKTIQYKLKDWLVSRQRYWGTPIPIIYCDKCGIVEETSLPVKLPEKVKFTGKGNPLASVDSFVNVKCPKCKGKAKRETDTMDTFFDSSWYFFRYCDSKNSKLPFDKKNVQYWMPVDQYIGGIEHACMHLIYARFFTKALRDLGLHNLDEPFAKLLCQGMVIKDGRKMSKSFGNVIDPGPIIKEYGADTARVFMLFAALPEKELEWSDNGVLGIFKFLNKVYRLIETPKNLTKEVSTREKSLIGKSHTTIKKVTTHIEKIELSLAIGALMEFVTDIYKYKEKEVNLKVLLDCVEILSLLLSPFAPHLAEELWEKLGKKGFISLEKWPKFDESKIDRKAAASELLISQTFNDIDSVVKLVKIEKLNKLSLFVSEKWKYDFFKKLKIEFEKTRNIGDLIKKLMIKEHGKEISNIISSVVKDPTKLPETVLSLDIEYNYLVENKSEFENKYKCEVEILKDSKENKAKQASPGRVGVLVS